MKYPLHTFFCPSAAQLRRRQIAHRLRRAVGGDVSAVDHQGRQTFREKRLDVEVLYLESALVQRALIAGNIAFGEMTGSLMSAPKLQGADLVMVAGFLNQLMYRLIARPEIKTPADLRGKRVGVSRFGAGADRATRLLLTKLGLNPEKDLTLIQVGGAPTRLAA